LMIDEVDKSSNNQLFISFLGLLRDKYLLANDGNDFTFHSVILVGVHDVKTLKLKIAPDGSGKINSPWNIAADFRVDLSFNPLEISTMLKQYSDEAGIAMDIPAVAERIYYYTSGYPYLVSKMCKIVDEIILPETEKRTCDVADIELAFRKITYSGYSTTLFDDLAKNLANYPDLYDTVYNLIFNGVEPPFDLGDTTINQGILYGIFADKNGRCKIHNRIFEHRILSLIITKQMQINAKEGIFSPPLPLAKGLDVFTVLKRFQTFMKENYSKRDGKFLERHGSLVFLAFLKPIINGKGYEFKEPVVGDERRMDIVVVFENKRYVIELKRWYGEDYHQRGLQQLSDYLDIYGLKQGFLLIYNFNKNKKYKEQTIPFGDKEIFTVWV